MTPAEHLKRVLSGIDWQKHIDGFLAVDDAMELLAESVHRISGYCEALSSAEAGNPAVSFLAAAQAESHHVAALIPLALYKPAAASMRAAFESVMYYTYFRTHLAELATLVADPDYYIDKATLLEFHKLHTPQFKARQDAWGLVGQVNRWYSRTSAVIHGQLPGKWVSHTDFAQLQPVPETREEALAEFNETAELTRRFLLCSMDADRWTSLSAETRTEFLKGIPGPLKARLGLSIL